MKWTSLGFILPFSFFFFFFPKLRSPYFSIPLSHLNFEIQLNWINSKFKYLGVVLFRCGFGLVFWGGLLDFFFVGFLFVLGFFKGMQCTVIQFVVAFVVNQWWCTKLSLLSIQMSCRWISCKGRITAKKSAAEHTYWKWFLEIVHSVRQTWEQLLMAGVVQ